VTVFLFLALAIASFITAKKQMGSQKSILLNNGMGRFLLGVTMSAINPVQIPFWFLWSAYLFSIQLLQPLEIDYLLYMAGIAMGTLAGLAAFIFGGKWLVEKVKASQRTINIVVGMVFLISAIIQLYRVWNKPFGTGIG
jgi:putative Ca2+/H+ antiporter (TMEM165/GDT1 family)